MINCSDSARMPDHVPIEHYGVVGDCRMAALVSRTGSIDWLCLPHYSSPSIFAHLLDRERGGRFSIRPSGAFKSVREYLGPSCVLQTEFETNSGTARLIDVVPIIDGLATLNPMREILRIIEGVSGEVDFEVELDPRPNYGRSEPQLTYGRQLGWSYTWLNEVLAVRSDIDLVRAGRVLHGSVRVRAGERKYLSLCYAQGDLAVLSLTGADADRRLDRTLDWWRSWGEACSYTGPYKAAVLRSALTLKLLSFALSGAIIAAPTTSLPEAIGGDRNWDYRYCWLRDAGLTMQAFIGLGFRAEARAFLNWLLHATRLTWPELQVVYDVYGRTRLQEQELAHFEGYRGSRPVRIGNGAHTQLQLDIYGEVVFAADVYVAGGGTFEPVESRMLAGFGEVVCKQWRRADQGIWEIRGEPRHHTFSKVMCWVALDRLLALGDKGVLSLGASAARFRREKEAIAETIESRGFNAEIGSYTSELDGSMVDASLLQMPCVGYKPGDPRRIASTYELISQRLGRNGLLDRYQHGHDGFSSREGTFGICTFWAIHNLACQNRLAEARRLFDHALSFANDLGLFAEQIDPDSGAALGNFPQAFTHVGLINAAMAVATAEKDRGC
jgi:GH15 family glucan-1,4-alpha-glucosidase